MRNSHGATSGIGHKKWSMEDFDALPKYIRNILKDAPYNLMWSGSKRVAAKVLKEKIADVQRRSCLACYGPHHPQAK